MGKEVIIVPKVGLIRPSLPQACCYCLAPFAGVVTLEVKHTQYRGFVERYERNYKVILTLPYCEKHLQEAKKYLKFFRVVRPFAVFFALLGGVLTCASLCSAMEPVDDEFGCCCGMILAAAIGAGWLIYKLTLRVAKAIGVRYLWPEGSVRDVDPVGGTLGVLSRIEGDGVVCLRLAFTNEKYTDLMVKSGFSCIAAT